jgi:hypothetical protein
MHPIRFERDDLLDDARFWALLYQYWVKPRVGDGFDDGEEYFFSVRERAVNAFFRELERVPLRVGSYPEYSVLLTLRNGWRIGVVLSMYPGDFEVQDVVAAPSAEDLIVFGLNGGNSRLPALRWDELLMLRDAVLPPNPAVKARAVLLLYPAVCLSSDLRIGTVRRVLQHAWRKCGIAVGQADELPARAVGDFIGSRRLYPELKETLWRNHPKHGWINDSHHSLRNPKVEGARRVLPAIRRLFSTLEGGSIGVLPTGH